MDVNLLLAALTAGLNDHIEKVVKESVERNVRQTLADGVVERCLGLLLDRHCEQYDHTLNLDECIVEVVRRELTNELTTPLLGERGVSKGVQDYVNERVSEAIAEAIHDHESAEHDPRDVVTIDKVEKLVDAYLESSRTLETAIGDVIRNLDITLNVA